MLPKELAFKESNEIALKLWNVKITSSTFPDLLHMLGYHIIIARTGKVNLKLQLQHFSQNNILTSTSGLGLIVKSSALK